MPSPKQLARHVARRIYRKIWPKKSPFVRIPQAKLFEQAVLDKQFLSDEPGGKPQEDPRLKGKARYLLTDVEIGNKQLLESCRRIKSIDEVPEAEIKNSAFYIYFECDSDAYYHVQKIIAHQGTFFPPIYFEKVEYRFVDRLALETIEKTWSQGSKLSHLVVNVHENLCEAVRLTAGLEGDFVEIGVYRGTSAYTVMNFLTALGLKRKAWLFDTFDGFDYEEAKSSSDAIWAGTHKLFGAEETMRRITELLADTGQEFSLHKKNICQGDLPGEIAKIAVANIDVDIYEATLAALIRVAPRMVPGGIMICEDPTSTPGLYGAYVAMREFLETVEGQKFLPIFKGGQYFLLKKYA